MIDKIKQKFNEHPSSVDETYLEHMGVASYFAFHMFTGSIACFFHAFFPFLFVKTGSYKVTHLYERMVSGRNRKINKTQKPQTYIADYVI